MWPQQRWRHQGPLRSRDSVTGRSGRKRKHTHLRSRDTVTGRSGRKRKHTHFEQSLTSICIKTWTIQPKIINFSTVSNRLIFIQSSNSNTIFASRRRNSCNSTHLIDRIYFNKYISRVRLQKSPKLYPYSDNLTRLQVRGSTPFHIVPPIVIVSN